MGAVVLLGATVALLLGAHRRVRPAVSVGLGVVVGLATGVVEVDGASRALLDLAAPLGFLAAAVPLAVLLSSVGFFEAAAGRVGVGPRLMPSLWVFAALVTTVFNLDAAIVLLTPLYLQIARRHGLDPVLTAFQPVLLASFASSALPVSNLTNLIVAEQTDASAIEFATHLGPVSLAATTVGWLAYRRLRTTAAPEHAVSDHAAPDHAAPDHAAPPTRRAWTVGLPAVVTLLAGFTLGDALGVPAWAVAGLVAVALMLVTRSVPWRSLPVEAGLVAGGLAVLAAAAEPSLGLERVLAGEGPVAQIRAMTLGVVGANTINNLPALLVGLPNLDDDTVWAYLAGVNVGPALWITGSLAGLLWADIMRRHGHPISPLDYARIGVRVGGPALGAALAATVLVGLASR